MLGPTSGSPSSLWNFFTRICEDALLCDTTSSPAAGLPAAAPAASLPALLLLLSLLGVAALPASPEPCSCREPKPASIGSCCCACGAGLYGNVTTHRHCEETGFSRTLWHAGAGCQHSTQCKLSGVGQHC